MAIQSAAGALLKVSKTAPTTYNAAGFTTLKSSAKTVGEITNIGEFGKEFALVSANSLSHRATRKRKGSYNNGSLAPTLNLDPADEGQGVMEELLDDDDPGYFIVVLQDGTCYGFEGLVMTFRPNVGEIDSIVTATCSIEITEKDVIKIPVSP